MLKIILLLAVSAFSYPDLYAPLTIDLIGKSKLFDTILVTTDLVNKGTTTAYSPIYPSTYTAVNVGVDSFNIRLHYAASIQAGYFYEFYDTIVVIGGPHSIQTWCDPLGRWAEGGGEVNNNVRSQYFNFRPQIIRDTILLIDTLVVRDTLKIVQKDTVKITLRDTLRISIRDTIIKNDTIRVVQRDTVIKTDTIKVYTPPTTFAKTSGSYLKPIVHTTVYNSVGQPVWSGLAPQGGFPQVRLKQGLHLIVQGDNARRFRVAYK
jgi:hypothetical protein